MKQTAQRLSNDQARVPQTHPLEVPERPALAPQVQLIGEMQGTGFTTRQWLILRNGQFIQVTELLYRIAEQVTGTHTLEQIAEEVTAATEWSVRAHHVRQLLETKLMPLGLIAPADGTVGSHSAEQAHSPLQVNLRTIVLNRSRIEPIARMLQVLFAPLVLIPLLILIAGSHAWLYLVHGIAKSMSDVLQTPGLVLVTLVILLLAAIFHEFGHAAALRYGGGQVRGMGAGFYFLYPAFYTDVTDSYRLGRWARVRTDLGGVYFHLIFAFGLLIIALLTRQEFLLFVVVLINLEVLRQFIPFLRLDGYWVLADLTGIPDFFSQMGPFLASILPLPGWQSRRLPPLKPWVKATFLIYILLTIPVLILLYVLLLRGLPHFLGITWDSFLLQTRRFTIAQHDGDLLTMGGTVVQMLLLALPVIGTVYWLSSASRILLRVLWNRSKPALLQRLGNWLLA